MHILIPALIGAAVGWLVGRLMHGKGFSLVLHFLLGIVGGVAGGWLFERMELHWSGTLHGSMLSAAVGAVAVLVVGHVVKDQ
jgi:uncharacterized membrane protein YeaQ/YmgE (transglycosylase-associated protein family)